MFSIPIIRLTLRF